MARQGVSDAARLAARPLATLTVADPSAQWTLHIVGRFLRSGIDGESRRAYRPSLLSIRLIGPGSRITIAVEEFCQAQPDPLREHAPAIVRHLAQAHTEELLACVRAHGHDALAVEPRGLDRYGIELTAILPDGVHPLRLSFPGGPVEALTRIKLGFWLPLSCRCGDESR